MLADIEAYKVNCVIVKDLSRFGRNHIEAGYYIEKYFSQRGVRIISVNDRAETNDGITNLNPYGPKNIPLINLMNETVSNELSKSKQCVLNTYASEGKYIAPRAFQKKTTIEYTVIHMRKYMLIYWMFFIRSECSKTTRRCCSKQ